MIGRLRGVLGSQRGEIVCIDVAGVGYEVHMTPRDLVSLPGVGEEVVVHVHTNVRDDGITLYGFASEGDRDLFRVLLTAGGVGPKLAMAILAALPAAEVIRAVTMGDADALTVAAGVGKRGAQRIVLELAPKLTGKEIDLTGRGGLATVRQALEGLGYTFAEISVVVAELSPDDPVEDQIRTALQRLGGR
ncbi:MAG: Holliday junction branch migration protein RuvA [Actinobacteria bacterium]|nr:Holliday junction branch migration protein RuvA [Actinomycetota bacterium]MCI0543151.1 Holliday junction branch migration protein RuvA [Actinomycetota bacterium]MCI0678635.1 Holliday junction branch migration protein RuvA [Actinomycetota bacterium]